MARTVSETNRPGAATKSRSGRRAGTRGGIGATAGFGPRGAAPATSTCDNAIGASVPARANPTEAHRAGASSPIGDPLQFLAERTPEQRRARRTALARARRCPTCRDRGPAVEKLAEPCLGCKEPTGYYSCAPGYCRACAHDSAWVPLSEVL